MDEKEVRSRRRRDLAVVIISGLTYYEFLLAINQTYSNPLLGLGLAGLGLSRRRLAA